MRLPLTEQSTEDSQESPMLGAQAKPSKANARGRKNRMDAVAIGDPRDGRQPALAELHPFVVAPRACLCGPSC